MGNSPENKRRLHSWRWQYGLITTALILSTLSTLAYINPMCTDVRGKLDFFRQTYIHASGCSFAGGSADIYPSLESNDHLFGWVSLGSPYLWAYGSAFSRGLIHTELNGKLLTQTSP